MVSVRDFFAFSRPQLVRAVLVHDEWPPRSAIAVHCRNIRSKTRGTETRLLDDKLDDREEGMHARAHYGISDGGYVRPRS